jgi:hypothetical protein
VTRKVVGGVPGNGDGRPPRRRIRSEGVPAWPVVSAVIALVLVVVLVVAVVLLLVYVV